MSDFREENEFIEKKTMTETETKRGCSKGVSKLEGKVKQVNQPTTGEKSRQGRRAPTLKAVGGARGLLLRVKVGASSGC